MDQTPQAENMENKAPVNEEVQEEKLQDRLNPSMETWISPVSSSLTSWKGF